MTAPATACPSANDGVCTRCQPQLRHHQRSIEQLCQENAALEERIEQMERER
jgi:hypothetical protein